MHSWTEIGILIPKYYIHFLQCSAFIFVFFMSNNKNQSFQRAKFFFFLEIAQYGCKNLELHADYESDRITNISKKVPEKSHPENGFFMAVF